MEMFEKYLQQEKKEKDLEIFWDKKSSWFFQKTEERKKEFLEELVFKVIKQRKLLEANSKILDIGCGTGRHLLKFSDYSSDITGIDISSKMLDYAKEKLRHISGAKLLHGDWMELFTEEKKYDFVFASMTPAISSIKNIERMCSISRKYCMLERFVAYKDEIREEIEEFVGKKLNRLHQNEKEYTYAVWNIVWNLGYFPEIFFERKTYNVEKTLGEYMEQIICTEKEKSEISRFLKKKEINGKIPTREYTVKAIILWDVTPFL